MILVEYLHIIFSGTLSADPLVLFCKWFALRRLVLRGGGKWLRGGRLWGQWLQRAPQPPRTGSTPPVQISGIGGWSEQPPPTRWSLQKPKYQYRDHLVGQLTKIKQMATEFQSLKTDLEAKVTEKEVQVQNLQVGGVDKLNISFSKHFQNLQIKWRECYIFSWWA